MIPHREVIALTRFIAITNPAYAKKEKTRKLRRFESRVSAMLFSMVVARVGKKDASASVENRLMAVSHQIARPHILASSLQPPSPRSYACDMKSLVQDA